MNYGDRVTPGTICFSCAKYQFRTCKAKNHEKNGLTLSFTGVDKKGNPTVFGCESFQQFDEEYYEMQQAAESNNNRIIEAAQMNDDELNIALYRMIKATSPDTQSKTFNYWKYFYPDEYAKEMVDDTNGTKAKNDNPKKNTKRKKNVFLDLFNKKEKNDGRK